MTSVSFYVFQNISFTKGDDDDNENDLISNVLYQYKNLLSNDELHNLLNVIVSLYTFTTITIGDKEVSLLSFDSLKIAIFTYNLSDNSSIFFVLGLPSDLSDRVIQNALSRITDVIFFILGNTFIDDLQILKNFLNKEGNKIIDTVLNTVDSVLANSTITFPPLHKINSDCSAIIITTLIASIQKLSPKIFGAACFIDQKLLISQIPICLCSLFPYISIVEGNCPVFLTKFQREKIIETPNFSFEIPNLGIIPSLLFAFSDSLKKIIFYVLTDPSISENDSIINKMKEMIDVSFPFIYENLDDLQIEENIANTISYDSNLLELKVGKTADAFESNYMFGRNLFLKNNRLTEIIMKNPKDLTICYKVISFEHYSFIEDNGKDGFLEMYQKCISLNPSLKQYIDVFSPKESI